MLTFFEETLIVLSVPFTIVYVILPVLFVVAPNVMQRAFFLNFVINPFANYDNLAANGVKSKGRNFFIKNGRRVDDNSAKRDGAPAVLGAWHILPQSLSLAIADPNDDAIEATLRTGEEPVFIYLHGNSFDRATRHRCELYNTLSAMNFHVVTIDYRGFGNSSGVPTEDGLAADSHSVYEYVRSLVPSTKSLYVWGHSMGTGVAIRLIDELCQRDVVNRPTTTDEGQCPTGLVLESPFNNLRDVVRNHPFSALMRFCPFFDEIFIRPLMRCGLVMNSDERIGRIKCPILIMHAADDHIIPVQLARKLVRSAQKTGRRVTYVEFEEKREFKHLYIYRADELSELMKSFFHQCVHEKS